MVEEEEAILPAMVKVLNRIADELSDIAELQLNILEELSDFKESVIKLGEEIKKEGLTWRAK